VLHIDVLSQVGAVKEVKTRMGGWAVIVSAAVALVGYQLSVRVTHCGSTSCVKCSSTWISSSQEKCATTFAVADLAELLRRVKVLPCVGAYRY
jgi:hypothetical protein